MDGFGRPRFIDLWLCRTALERLGWPALAVVGGAIWLVRRFSNRQR
jgi:hypothetical protein